MERGGYGSQNPPPLFSRDDGDELAAVPTWDPLFSLFTNSSYFDRCIRGENPPGYTPAGGPDRRGGHGTLPGKSSPRQVAVWLGSGGGAGSGEERNWGGKRGTSLADSLTMRK